MDKVAHRTLLAERHARNRYAAKLAVQAAADRVDVRRHVINATRELLNQKRDSVKRSKELWAKGPLAANLLALPSYGVVNEPMRADNSQIKVRDSIVKERCAWAGGVRYLSLALGDRVVFIEGPWKGRIDTIQEINAEIGCVRLTNTKVRSRVPEFMAKLYRDEPSFNPEMDQQPGIPISALRLVHPIVNPATNKARDVIIEKLVVSNIRRDEITGTTEWDRVIPALNVIIPWPEREAPDTTIHPCDTTRDDVEMITFVPTLVRPPMAPSLIDELRNKYSVFRTRHDPAWVQKKNELAEARKAAKVVPGSRVVIPDSMLTPKQEAGRMRKQAKRELGQPVLSEEMLSKIGEIMVKNQTAMREAGGVSKVESTLGSQ